MLLLDQDRRRGPARHAHREFLAQSDQPIVPPLAGIDESERRQVRMLFAQQRPDEV